MLIDGLQNILVQSAPAMPPEAWGVTGAVLLILVVCAACDAFTALVPEALIFIGLFIVTVAQGACISWDAAATHLRDAIAVGIFIWTLNFAWFWKFRYDALGMGDAKWSMLAVACFGITPVILAWGVGSVFATIFLGLFRLFKHRIWKVTFSPFLLIGLGVGLFWVRFW